MSTPFDKIIEDNDQTRARREHLEELRKLVGNVYPNKFERSRVCGVEDTITAIIENFRKHEPVVKEGERPAQDVLESANAELNKLEVRISGRISSPPRVMGKAAFVHLSDGVSRLQIYVRKADVKGIHNDDGAPIEEGWELFNLLDHGDFIGVNGYLFITKTGELSVHVRELQFLAKAMLPMPDKLHGLTDPEIRQRQRYADLIAGSLKVDKSEDVENESASRELSSREVFERRSRVIREMRRYLDDHGYIEVETPMLTAKATGAAAKPFETYHNALGIKLYARIAPELYLKRLVVGGFEKVYELNRNFRNEGIDRTHNPEFTMLEFYCAYMDVNGMMDFCEEMIRSTVYRAIGQTYVRYIGRKVDYVERAEGQDRFVGSEVEQEIDFSKPFHRFTMKEAIVNYWPKEDRVLGGEIFDVSWLEQLPRLRTLTDFFNYRLADKLLARKDWDRAFAEQKWNTFREVNEVESYSRGNPNEPPEAEAARLVVAMFEHVAELDLIHPTFITDFPKPISPLSKASPTNPAIAERFELFIAGLECANGFSELNDPKEQYDRFLEQAQARERGDEEAMVLDEDYIRALSYGMPPAAGIGIGIDRLVMLLTNKRSIRDVILFPHMRPERKAEESKDEAGEET
ncbi:MAG: lysyl-tRNA synthetase, class [Acidobacteriota bacterium]|jgi:lysyl-tRNA synthetase class 2|nr:lysyl-tRNA synthetase, class [Acidobacteriota bacterium]